MEGKRWWGIGGAGWDDESYNYILDLDGIYFVYVCVRCPRRARGPGAKKVAERRRKERMGNVPLTEFSRNRVSDTGVGGGS